VSGSQLFLHHNKGIRHPRGWDLLNFLDAGDMISELLVKGRELGAVIQDADLHSRTSGVAAKRLSLFDQDSPEPVSLIIRMDRQQSEVSDRSAELYVIASRRRTIAFGE